VANSLKKMGFTKANAAVNKKRIILGARFFNNGQGGGMG
jgi:hypothetical protein